MAYADPQSVTIAGSAVSLPRTSSGANAGTFRSPDRSTTLNVSHQYGKRIRHLIRIDTEKLASDPLMAGQSMPASMSAYLVVDQPQVGYSNADAKAVVDGLLAYLSAASGAKITQLLGGEN